MASCLESVDNRGVVWNTFLYRTTTSTTTATTTTTTATTKK